MLVTVFKILCFKCAFKKNFNCSLHCWIGENFLVCTTAVQNKMTSECLSVE